MSKLTKISANNIKQTGFQSKAQMRYLLMLSRTHPEKYKWVLDVLKEHGVPKTEKIEPAYWSEPYSVSPDTPSYTYVSRSANFINRLIRFAQSLDDAGFEDQADQIDEIVYVEKINPRDVVNPFWASRGKEIKRNDSDSILKAFDLLRQSEGYDKLDSAGKEEAKRIVGDKILGRDNE